MFFSLMCVRYRQVWDAQGVERGMHGICVKYVKVLLSLSLCVSLFFPSGWFLSQGHHLSQCSQSHFAGDAIAHISYRV